MYLASHHLVGPGSVDMGANPAAYRGSLPDKADSLWNLVLETSVPLFIREFKLRRKAKEIEFWGPEELTLVVRHIEAELLAHPFQRLRLLTHMSFNQLALGVGLRPGSGVARKFTPPSFNTSRW